MKPGDKVTITSNKIGILNGTINGWNTSGLKVTLYDSWVTVVKWYDIVDMHIN